MMRDLYSFCLLFLCLLLAAGRELTAQNKHDSLQKAFSGTFSKIATPKMSKNGKWLTVWKSDDLNRDTLLIFDVRYPGKPTGYRVKAENVVFVGSDHLLIKSANRAELLNLEKQTGTYFNGVKRVQALKNNDQFVLHYNAEGNNRLELRQANGDLIGEAGHVSSFYVSEDDQVYVVSKTESSESNVSLIRDQTPEKVYHSPREISSLTVDPGGQGIMIHEINPDNASAKLRYLDLKTKTSWPLNEVLSTPFQRAFTKVISEGNIYFLKVLEQKKKQNDTVVDIWYGNDKQLEEKFYPPSREVYDVWEPKRKKLQQLGNKQLTKSACIGNERFFLSLDPYLLQDYTREKPLLKLYRYDRISDTYTVIDTLSSHLYTSPNGQYALYFKNNAWQVYHLPSGTRDCMGNGDLETPYFTTDGKTVLFEGDGGLWRYDPKQKDLVQSNSFEGYQATILNGTSHMTLQGFNFFEKTVSIDKYLVIKLDDPLKNRSMYILWKDGQYKTIVAPTTKRIQSFSYNQSFTCFYWLEEDYNLPPRLVYKEMDKQERVLYQSNPQDTAIRSLKQEIISYANSDGIPMKGILYCPLNVDPSKQYPMVVRIYEKQRDLANRYPYPSYCESLGFNIRLFLENGYFVYLPDILIQGKAGPGLDALDCVNRALDALAHNPLINRDRIGLIGHSFGGYETDYIATRSSRFAAYISGSGHSDIIWDSHCFNYNFLAPDHVRIEANVYKLGKPFSADKGLYFKNNPLYHAEKVNAPVLLWTGVDDQNVTSDHTMAFYNALCKNNKDVIALFYKGEGHYLRQKQAQVDLTSRILDWFGYFLKEEEMDTEWIEKGTGKGK